LHTRWVMSYLRGPMTRQQIELVMREGRERAATSGAAGVRRAVAAAAERTSGPAAAATTRPVLAGVEERFQAARRAPTGATAVTYKPALWAKAALHYVSARDGIDEWRQVQAIAPLLSRIDSNPWDDDGAIVTAEPIDFAAGPDDGATFAELPTAAAQAKAYQGWARALADQLYRSRQIELLQCRKPKLGSTPGESEGDFRARLTLLLREERDLALAKLQQKYEPKLRRLQERRRNAEQVVEQQRAQRSSAGLSAVLNAGVSILGSLFGRRRTSTGVTRAVRDASRVGREHGDVKRAQEDVAALLQQEKELDAEFAADADAVRAAHDPLTIELVRKELLPRKSDIDVGEIALLWTPWAAQAGGDVPLAD
ncbi:MAG: hypothetical protein KDE27_27820, partial [Planctomycetes bacterium]|nr:hypothetical protein [Planctomycetota bacterium]